VKLSPISVPYRAFQKGFSLLIMLFFISSTGAGGLGGSVLIVLGAVGVLAVTVGYELLYYQRFSYVLTDDTLDIHSGVVSRRDREIPYRRIQNVDVSQNIVQRALGIAAVNVETAGGSSTEAVIQYVTVDAAEQLQTDVRRLKRRERSDTATDEESKEAVAPDREELFSIEPSELALVGVFSFDPRVAGIILAVLSGSIPFVSPALPGDATGVVLFVLLAIIGVSIIALSWVVGAISAVVNFWGFTLTRTEDELQYERGLLQRYSGTIPFDKIQTITIEDNPLKRQFGYATLGVETAGYAPGQAGSRGSEAAVPLATIDRVHRLAHELEEFGIPEYTRPPKRIRIRYFIRYVMAIAVISAVAFAITWVYNITFPWYLPLIAVLLSPIAAHYKWLHRGYWLGDDHLAARSGFWTRQAKIVPYYRIQTVIDSRTIFQRRWDVGTVIADTAGSLSVLGNDAAAIDIDEQEVSTLREELNDRLQASLRKREQQKAQEREQRRLRATEQQKAQAQGVDVAEPASFEWASPVDTDPESASPKPKPKPKPIDTDSLTPAITPIPSSEDQHQSDTDESTESDTNT